MTITVILIATAGKFLVARTQPRQREAGISLRWDARVMLNDYNMACLSLDTPPPSPIW